MSALKNGAWTQWMANTYHQSSPNLAEYLRGYLSPDLNVIDFGCGNGFYIHALAEAGFQCLGVEGYELNNFLHDQIVIKDLTYPFDLPVRGNVLSFEVGEHLDKTSEQLFLNTITKHCTNKLILSWATPGQPGVGHINCLPQSYIISEVVRRGFDFNQDATDEIRKHVDLNCDWLIRNLLVFDKCRK